MNTISGTNGGTSLADLLAEQQAEKEQLKEAQKEAEQKKQTSHLQDQIHKVAQEVQLLETIAKMLSIMHSNDTNKKNLEVSHKALAELLKNNKDLLKENFGVETVDAMLEKTSMEEFNEIKSVKGHEKHKEQIQQLHNAYLKELEKYGIAIEETDTSTDIQNKISELKKQKESELSTLEIQTPEGKEKVYTDAIQEVFKHTQFGNIKGVNINNLTAEEIQKLTGIDSTKINEVLRQTYAQIPYPDMESFSAALKKYIDSNIDYQFGDNIARKDYNEWIAENGESRLQEVQQKVKEIEKKANEYVSLYREKVERYAQEIGKRIEDFEEQLENWEESFKIDIGIYLFINKTTGSRDLNEREKKFINSFNSWKQHPNFTEILGGTSVQSILRNLSHRIDFIQQNIDHLQKEIFSQEKKPGFIVYPYGRVTPDSSIKKEFFNKYENLANAQKKADDFDMTKEKTSNIINGKVSKISQQEVERTMLREQIKEKYKALFNDDKYKDALNLWRLYDQVNEELETKNRRKQESIAVNNAIRNLINSGDLHVDERISIKRSYGNTCIASPRRENGIQKKRDEMKQAINAAKMNLDTAEIKLKNHKNKTRPSFLGTKTYDDKTKTLEKAVEEAKLILEEKNTENDAIGRTHTSFQLPDSYYLHQEGSYTSITTFIAERLQPSIDYKEDQELRELLTEYETKFKK